MYSSSRRRRRSICRSSTEYFVRVLFRSASKSRMKTSNFWMVFIIDLQRVLLLQEEEEYMQIIYRIFRESSVQISFKVKNEHQQLLNGLYLKWYTTLHYCFDVLTSVAIFYLLCRVCSGVATSMLAIGSCICLSLITSLTCCQLYPLVWCSVSRRLKCNFSYLFHRYTLRLLR